MTISTTVTTGYELTVADVIDETADSKSFVLQPPSELRDRFTYLPGQFLTVRVPSERTGHVARSYSLSSAPGIDDHLKVTVKRTVDGYASHWLCDNVTPGSTMTVLPPSGKFTHTDHDADLLLFAAGSGVTPIMSILKTALLRSDRSVVMFYANRDQDSIIFRDELDDYAARFADRLTVHHWLDVVHGFPSSERIAALAGESGVREVFVCGPKPFMDMVGNALASAGVPRERLHQEVFVSLSGDPFAAPSAMDGSGEAVQTVVHLDGEAHEFGWPTDRTLVDVLLDRGVDVPFSCRSGECGSCACTVVAGKVIMKDSGILDPDDLAEGYILGCQSRPDVGPIEIEF
ncbi:ferredoxin--NADP reductase [Gordonia rubripertincta]|uniref:ferredoxin--NADP reductase n=1 Tax=Gordonia rubripertincta TaxID=36822 RepID=UPI0015FCC59B|nr:ferredoxin--NADP reductase [Gordonia rubripertincta]QMU21019.1 ferredoxin--NADP reductase [Gordonia rubripertincta]